MNLVLQPRFLHSLRVTLLAVGLFTACTSDGGGGGGGGKVPAELVGKWNQSGATASQFCDSGGHCKTADGESFTFTLKANGDFEINQLLQSVGPSCEFKLFFHWVGTVTVSGQSLTTNAGTAHRTKTDTCGETGPDLDEDLKINATTYTWKLGTDGAVKTLSLSSSELNIGPMKYQGTP